MGFPHPVIAEDEQGKSEYRRKHAAHRVKQVDVWLSRRYRHSKKAIGK
jgi:hypothetical protein